MSNNFVTLVMAAGMGKRMKSDLPKVLHQVAGQPMVKHVIELAQRVGSERTILIIGHQRELVIEETKDAGVEWVVQEQQLGTGDAVKVCSEKLKDYDGDVLVLSGDVPLLRPESVQEAFEIHRETGAVATVFTFEPDDPEGYGRIVRGEKGELIRIVEQKDADVFELAITEVNGGIYFFRSRELFAALDLVSNDNAASEFYITDTIEILRQTGKRLSAYLVKDYLEMAGVNSQEQLAELERYFMTRQAN